MRVFGLKNRKAQMKSEDADEVDDDGADEDYRPRAKRSSKKMKKSAATKVIATSGA